MAQVTEISICNQGLGWLGANLITSFDDISKESNLCEANYHQLRDAVLEIGEWSFAMKRAELPQLGDNELTLGYSYAYQLPSDCIRVVKVTPDNLYSDVDGMQWELEDRKILSDQGSCFIRYIARIEDPQRFSPGFVNALAYRIASELAIPITRSRALQEQMFSLYEKRADEGLGLDGMQGRSRRMRASWSHKSRRGSSVNG
jgi:hypothetical protein